MNIIIPKRELVVASRPTCKLVGEYRIQVVDTAGELVRDTGFQKNLITDAGLHWMADRFYKTTTGFFGPATFVANNLLNICIGAGTTPAEITDTELEDELAIQSSNQFGEAFSGHFSNPVTGTSEDWATALFPLLTETQTINEVGCKVFSGAPIFSRLVLAEPVQALAGQQFRVTYKLTKTITPIAPIPVTFTVTGTPGYVSTGMQQLEGVHTTGANIFFSRRSTNSNNVQQTEVGTQNEPTHTAFGTVFYSGLMEPYLPGRTSAATGTNISVGLAPRSFSTFGENTTFSSYSTRFVQPIPYGNNFKRAAQGIWEANAFGDPVEIHWVRAMGLTHIFDTPFQKTTETRLIYDYQLHFTRG